MASLGAGGRALDAELQKQMVLLCIYNGEAHHKRPGWIVTARHDVARAFAFVFLRHLPFLSVPSPGTGTRLVPVLAARKCGDCRPLQWSLMTRARTMYVQALPAKAQ